MTSFSGVFLIVIYFRFKFLSVETANTEFARTKLTLFVPRIFNSRRFDNYEKPFLKLPLKG